MVAGSPYGRTMKLRRRSRAAWSALAAATLLVLVPTSAVPAESTGWHQVGTGITRGVSGIAPAPTGWVYVRDNKLAGQVRVSLLSPSFQVTTVNWPGTDPSDLEAIAAVPLQGGRYVTCTSTGRCFSISVAGTSLRVLRSYRLPAGRVENESLALTQVNGTTVALWANRGSRTAPARIFAATHNVTQGTFGRIASAYVTVPYPTTGVRPVTDIAVVGNEIVVTSASDNGNNGPFDSAVYAVGTVGLSSGRATLSLRSPTSLGQYPGHKVEGIACSVGADILGTDDENLGGYVAAVDVC